ncbi:YkgJ family cysteine cluster protein [Candidatus Woesearchaeota archaeon]|nr:YkgJ family cysteine cluster protein [Candidatus Woesearchaeota archaeon]
MRFKCNKKEGCLRCTECCHFREKAFLSDEEDLALRKQMWDSKGVLYVYPFHRYTISLSNSEKERLERLGREKKVEIKFIPKKIMLDEEMKPVVLDWCVDADVCPFLVGDSCSIYSDRPEVCKTFPKDFMPKVDVEIVMHPGLGFEEALEITESILIMC